MTYQIVPYVWDPRSPNQVTGVKITTEDKGTERFLFIPNESLYDVAEQLANYIDSQAANQDHTEKESR